MNHKSYAKTYPVSPGQIKVIKMAQRYFDLSEDIYRDILETRYSVRSSKYLTFDQAKDLIQDNEAKGFVIKTTLASTAKKQQHTRPSRGPAHGFNTPRPVARDNDKVICMVKPEEIDKLNKIAALIPWRLENGLALFPDAVTIRGQKHLNELMRVVREGDRGVIFFTVQRGDGASVSPADAIDPEYGRLLRLAMKSGVEAFAYRALVTPEEIQLTERLPVIV